MPGSWTLNIGGTSYTDNSKSTSIPTYFGSQRAYAIGTGTLGNATTNLNNGLFFPRYFYIF